MAEEVKEEAGRWGEGVLSKPGGGQVSLRHGGRPWWSCLELGRTGAMLLGTGQGGSLEKQTHEEGAWSDLWERLCLGQEEAADQRRRPRGVGKA